ncbi:acetyltransferase [Candidatus Pelagibacter sp.]|nr:acetyltransferase [Candidatus Pelagibacter sp.]
MKNTKKEKNDLKKIIIIGGTGNGTVVESVIIDCIKQGQNLCIVGYLNDKEREINKIPVLGKIKRENIIKYRDCYFVYALSNIKLAEQRYQLLKNLNIPKKNLISILHPSSKVAYTSKLKPGVVLMPNVVISSNSIIHSHTQLYANSFLGHNSVLKEMVFVANNASIGGRVKVEKGSHIGSNSTLIERINIGKFSIVGLGSTVLRDVNSREIVAGNPGIVIRKLKKIKS